jgi:hypothetical protein
MRSRTRTADQVLDADLESVGHQHHADQNQRFAAGPESQEDQADRCDERGSPEKLVSSHRDSAHRCLETGPADRLHFSGDRKVPAEERQPLQPHQGRQYRERAEEHQTDEPHREALVESP